MRVALLPRTRGACPGWCGRRSGPHGAQDSNMGTRGQLVFSWKGRRVVIYNHYDSYPRYMGAELFGQLVALLRRFRGDVGGAARCWGELVQALSLAHGNEGEESHPFNLVHAFDDVESALSSALPLCVCHDEGLDSWIEFVWIVDLEKAVLKMAGHGGSAEWTFADIHRGGAFLQEWVLEAENAAYRGGGAGAVLTPFRAVVEAAAATKLQASARRFLEVSRGLRPGGVLVRVAAMRFRRAAAAW